jgi:hypothetical protein
MRHLLHWVSLDSTYHCIKINVQPRRLKEFHSTVPEIIDPVFAKTSQNARFLLSENERFGLVYVKIGSINSGTVVNVRARAQIIPL